MEALEGKGAHRRWGGLTEASKQFSVAMGAYLQTQLRERWLRRLAPFVDLKMFEGNWSERGGLVYALVSPTTKRFYIGKSDRCWKQRYLEHARAVLGCSQQRVHRFVRHFGLQQFCMIPLFWPC